MAASWTAPTTAAEILAQAQNSGITPNTATAAGLVSRQFQGPFSLWCGDGLFLGYNFVLTPQQDAWKAVFGYYAPFNGYWIYEANRNVAWQAINTTGNLDYWNANGAAQGNPQDWELFLFIDAGNGVVQIKNIYDSSPPNQHPSNFIQYSGTGLSAGASQANGAFFVVV